MKSLLIICQKVDRDDDVLGFFHGWISHIAPLCERVHVIALSKGVLDLPSNVSVFSLGKEKKRNKLFQALKFYWNVLKVLPSSDGVFVHMAPEYVRALYPVNLFFKKPIILWYAHIKVSPVAKWALSKVDRVFTPSKESFSYQSDSVISTGHGIDVNKFAPLDISKSNPKVILAQSRISRVKRIHVLIDAIAELKANYKGSFVCKIIGGTIYPQDEMYLSELKTFVAEKKLEDVIEWVGSVPNKDMPRFYNEASVFVRLQGGGGFGKTELESMACGTPVILPTSVYNDALGVFANDLYFPEDNALRCANNIQTVLSWGPERKKEYAELSRTIVSRDHNIENLAKRIVSTFDQINKK